MADVYHGSYLGGLARIMANSPSHVKNSKVAYFTDIYAYALICCRPPEENFVTAGMREDGKLHYYERFPDQLRVMYSGKKGYVYHAAAEKASLEMTRPYSFESTEDVAADGCDTVEDVYLALLAEIEKGALVLHRFEDIDPAEQKMMAEHVLNVDAKRNPLMAPFYEQHFSGLSIDETRSGREHAFSELKEDN